MIRVAVIGSRQPSSTDDGATVARKWPSPMEIGQPYDDHAADGSAAVAAADVGQPVSDMGHSDRNY